MSLLVDEGPAARGVKEKSERALPSHDKRFLSPPPDTTQPETTDGMGLELYFD